MDRDDLPDSAEFPDSAMASGSDAGAPGEHLGPADLGPDEQRLLQALESDVDRTPADEDADLVAEAAEDETPLPGAGGAQDDGLNPRFSNPEQA
ncbi:hypothetical protein [Geodermatophilus sp. URMC 64]